MATSLGIRTRLESVEGMRSQYAFLDVARVQQAHDHILARYYVEGMLKPHSGAVPKYMDISDAGPDEVRGFLASLGIADEHKVWVIWCSTEAGISTRFREFAKYYDDLWYPSSDDVWLTDESLSWVLEFNHEEAIGFVKGS